MHEHQFQNLSVSIRYLKQFFIIYIYENDQHFVQSALQIKRANNNNAMIRISINVSHIIITTTANYNVNLVPTSRGAGTAREWEAIAEQNEFLCIVWYNLSMNKVQTSRAQFLIRLSRPRARASNSGGRQILKGVFSACGLYY